MSKLQSWAGGPRHYSSETLSQDLPDQPAAAPANAGLPLGMVLRCLNFFLEQRREHQQRIGRQPGQGGRFIRRATQRRIQFRIGVPTQELPEQPLFESFELAFLPASIRHDLCPRPSVFRCVHICLSLCRRSPAPLHEPTHPRPFPGGERASVRVLSVPLLGGVRGGFLVPMQAQKR